MSSALELGDTLLASQVAGERAATPIVVRRGGRRYEPIRVIGRGGAGEVALVHDHDIDRAVAIKRLRSDTVCAAAAERFADEIRTIGQLEHPNIAPIHDVGVDDDGRQYFVMRYVAGETLEQIISKLAAGNREYHRKFTFEFRTQIFLGILAAIAFAHSKGIVHRDIKPANIMIGPYGEVVMMDWGVSRKVDAVPAPDGAIVGTPAYMAPEQAMGRDDLVDERTDVYALCAVFYELLALRHYLPAKSSVEQMLAAVICDSHEHASHLANPHQPRVPSELGWFIERGLRKDAAQRYPSLQDMVGELQRALSGEFRVQCYVTLMKRGGSRVVRFIDARPRLAIGVGAAILALVATGLVGLVAALA